MTYAAHNFDWPETLADMQDRRSHYLAMAGAAEWNNEPAIFAMWDDMARQEERKIAQHLIGLAHSASDAMLEDAQRRFAARVPVHAVGDEAPDQSEGAGAILWMLTGIMATVALVAWLVAGAADSGPGCPGADPAWLGACADAPMPEGAL